MGLIKTRPQLGLDGKETGLLDLEITYGGKEAPFSGIDASAPPQYIDPKCFVSANGFLVSTEQLLAVGFFPLDITLDQWLTLNPAYLGSGTFFVNGKYNNFVLGFTTSSALGPPASITVTYYIWVWEAGTTGTIPLTATLPVTQYAITIPATPASAFLISGGGNAISAGNVALTVGGVLINIPINIGDSSTTVINNVVAAINAAVGYPCTAIISSGWNTAELITTATGGAANSTTLSVVMTGAAVPAVAIGSAFAGGQDAINENFGIPINPLSWVVVGEILYLGGAGSMILQYSDTSAGINFSVLTQYLGAINLGKFNGQLVAGGIVPGPGQNIQFPEMVIAWSAPQALGTWNPEDTAGNVTGAGFNEEADISDYITGMFVMNSMLIVLRTQGIDYLTSLGSGVDPFSFNHISNSYQGEGCQDGRLVTQYDQVGLFVGNTDVFMFAGSLQEIGAKIRQILIPATQDPSLINRSASSGPMNINGTSIDTLALFGIDLAFYIYNLDNKTWMQINLGSDEVNGNFAVTAWWAATGAPSIGTQLSTQRLPILVTQAKQGVFPFHSLPLFWQLKAAVQNVDLGAKAFSNGSSVVFPSEEVMFGRDITIDALYVAAIGVSGQVVNFKITGQLKGAVVTVTGTLTMGAEADGTKVNHYKVFLNGTFLGKNPQLSYTVANSATGVINFLSFTKFAMFGSVDPNQRPV